MLIKFVICFSVFLAIVNCMEDTTTVAPPEHKAIRLTPETFDDEIKSGITIVMYHVWWCGRSKKFIPFFNYLVEKYKQSTIFKVRRVDCDIELKSSHLCKIKEVEDGYPAIILYKNGKLIREYDGERDIPELIDFIESHQTEAGIAGWLKREEQRELEWNKKQEEKAEKKRLLALAGEEVKGHDDDD